MSDERKGHQPSDEQLAAMGRGRRASAAVGAYLDALELHKPKRGRRVSVEDLEARLAKAQDEVTSSPSALKRLNAIQEAMDLEERIKAAKAPKVDLSSLEKDFIEFGAAYAESKKISYEAFRTVGVPVPVLKAAGISR